MKVTITHAETSGGMIRKIPYLEVSVLVQFSREEQNIIQKYGLEEVTVLERDPPANLRKVAADSLDIYHMKIQNLARGADTYICATPLLAKNYDADLRQALAKLKGYLDLNATPLLGREVFEL